MAARTAGDSRYSTVADESVIAPPKPCMVWKVRVGSTTMVGAVTGALLNATGAIGLSLSAPSGVVTHTCADTGAGLPGAACAGVAGAACAGRRARLAPGWRGGQDRVPPASAAASEATVSLRPGHRRPFPRNAGVM